MISKWMLKREEEERKRREGKQEEKEEKDRGEKEGKRRRTGERAPFHIICVFLYVSFPLPNFKIKSNKCD
jgi:hypothetical protein